MKLGSLSLCEILVFLCLGCSATQEPISELPKDKTDKIASAVNEGAWDMVAALTNDETDEFFQLVNRRALFEMQAYDKVLGSPPLKDVKVAAYDGLLKMLSAYESKRWDQVLQLPIPQDLPRPLREKLTYFQAESYREKSNFDAARTAFEKFLKDFRGSALESDVLFHLAEIEWALGKEKVGLEVYERIYRQHPLSDEEDLARQKLSDAGRLAQMDSDIHFSRIQKLQRAALFERASNELKSLRLQLKSLSVEDGLRWDLAEANLEFSQRNYATSEKMSARALRKKMKPDLQLDWRILYASSLIRQNKIVEGEDAYEKILNSDIPRTLRETILYRLGSIALDHFEYLKAAEYFQELKDDFSKGRYLESANWFLAWSLYMQQRSESENQSTTPSGNPAESTTPSNELTKKAIQTASMIPDLPDGKALTPQSLYWQGEWLKEIGNTNDADSPWETLRKDWNVSFYTLLTRDQPFSFLEDRRVRESLPLQDTGDLRVLKQDMAWRRLESFRAVGFQTWAKGEIESFLANHRNRDARLVNTVAVRLYQLEDWVDLIRWCERYYEKPIGNLDLTDPTAKFYYPIAYRDLVLKSAKEFNISPFLIWGVMREESRFEADVVSRAGAIGLMQLLPSLAKQLAAELGDGPFKRRQLQDPKMNIRWGAYYLSKLAKQSQRFNVSDDIKQAIQIGTYNAGFEAVSRWVGEKDSSRLDLFLEAIPFTETRGYIKRVLQSAYVYYKLYGDHAKEVARRSNESSL